MRSTELGKQQQHLYLESKCLLLKLKEHIQILSRNDTVLSYTCVHTHTRTHTRARAQGRGGGGHTHTSIILGHNYCNLLSFCQSFCTIYCINTTFSSTVSLVLRKQTSWHKHKRRSNYSAYAEQNLQYQCCSPLSSEVGLVPAVTDREQAVLWFGVLGVVKVEIAFTLHKKKQRQNTEYDKCLAILPENLYV